MDTQAEIVTVESILKNLVSQIDGSTDNMKIMETISTIYSVINLREELLKLSHIHSSSTDNFRQSYEEMFGPGAYDTLMEDVRVSRERSIAAWRQKAGLSTEILQQADVE